MRLFYTPNSPFARKARVVAHERGLGDRIEAVEVTVRDPASKLLPYNAVGRVPALELDDGTVLTESTLICHHLDAIAPGPGLLPAAGRERLEALRLDALAYGFLDGAAWWFREYRRSEAMRWDSFIGLERDRANRCLDMFEREVAGGRIGANPSLAGIALACALGFIDPGLKVLDWRQGRPALTAWFAPFNERPSMRATAPKM
jgi:glutathione S-transferase